jgi:hypothetical protein
VTKRYCPTCGFETNLSLDVCPTEDCLTPLQDVRVTKMPQESPRKEEKPQPEEPQSLTVNGKPFGDISKPTMRLMIDAKMQTLWRASRDLSANLHWFARRRFCTTSCGQETLIDDFGRCLVCGHPYSSPTLWGTSWGPQEKEILIPKASELVRDGKVDRKAVDRTLKRMEEAHDQKFQDKENVKE